MKKITIAALLAITAFFTACKKENAPIGNAKGIAGTWTGKWGDAGQAPQHFMKFEFKANGEAVRLDEQNQPIASGQWKLTGIEFECTYTQTATGEKHNIKGLYTGFDGTITGTWGWYPNKADGGTIELNKQ